MANNGESAAKTLAAIPVGQPYAVTASPVIRTERQDRIENCLYGLDRIRRSIAGDAVDGCDQPRVRRRILRLICARWIVDPIQPARSVKNFIRAFIKDPIRAGLKPIWIIEVCAQEIVSQNTDARR
jgi:hypothetical protein